MNIDMSLALRPWPTHDKSPQSIEEFIARINAERNGFKNLSQAVLQRQINNEKEDCGMMKDTSQDDMIEVSSQDGSENEEEQKKRLFLAREEVLRNIEYALVGFPPSPACLPLADSLSLPALRIKLLNQRSISLRC